MKAKLDPQAVFEDEGSAPFERLQSALAGAGGTHGLDQNALTSLQGVVWTKALKRMYCLVSR